MSSSGWDLFTNPVPADVYKCLQELGVEIIRQTDDEVLAKCPAHFERTGKEDRHPSWSINVESGMHNCFACGYSGTFVSLASYLLPSDVDAYEWTRERGGIEKAKRVLDRAKGVTIKELVSEEISEASLALFVDPPRSALESRNLTLESARKFGVMWDKKRDGWVIPIRHPYTGSLMGYQFKNKRYFRNYPKSVEKSKTLFGFEEHDIATTVVLLESPLDVVRIDSLGIGGVSTYGVHFSEEQMRLVLELSEDVIIALDNDRDGRKISKDIKNRYAHRCRMRFLSYEECPDAKDVGEMTDQQILQAVHNSIPSVLARF